MSRARAFLFFLPLLPLLPLLSAAACGADTAPLTGFDTPPPGSLVLGGNGVVVVLPFFWPDQRQWLRVRFNGQDAILQEGPHQYTYLTVPVGQGGRVSTAFTVAPGTYVVELVDQSGQTWGTSAPLLVAVDSTSQQDWQPATVLFTADKGEARSWNVDPQTKDGDPATGEITVTNISDQAATIERCLETTADRTCAPIGTVEPGADFRTVETQVPFSNDTTQELIIHPTSAPAPDYGNSLYRGSLSSLCPIERIIVHGTHPADPWFATSSCWH